MEIERAKEILMILSDGVDPITGEIFPEESPYHHPDVIRALMTSVYHLEQIQRREKRKRNLPDNAGKRWTADEINSLMDDFEQGLSVKELSGKFQRTRTSIHSKLLQLGKIELERIDEEKDN